MLRKRSRSLHKDQHHMDQMATAISDADSDYYYSSQSHAMGTNVKSNSIFNAPLLFVGLGPKGLLDSDSVRSPTSTLDVALLSNIGNPFRTPRSLLHEGQQRSWDCCKVGLGIIDSLEEECYKFSGKILKPSLTPQMIINAPNCKPYMDSIEASKSLPKDFCKLPYTAENGATFHKGDSAVLFEIGEETLKQEHQEPFGKSRSSSLDSLTPLDDDLSGLTGSDTDFDSENFASNRVSSPPHFIGGSQNSNRLLPKELNSNPVTSNEFVKSLSASEIELSEDYTCVISHGPNPKTTHIFCDCILETRSSEFKNHYRDEEKEKGVSSPVAKGLQTPNKYPSSDFLSFCYHCNKKLEEGEDIYIYRGDKSFCSLTCRDMEIMIDEELEESNRASENSPKLELGGELFEPGIPTVP